LEFRFPVIFQCLSFAYRQKPSHQRLFVHGLDATLRGRSVASALMRGQRTPSYALNRTGYSVQEFFAERSTRPAKPGLFSLAAPSRPSKCEQNTGDLFNRRADDPRAGIEACSIGDALDFIEGDGVVPAVIGVTSEDGK
jgi:hypothetical protein